MKKEQTLPQKQRQKYRDGGKYAKVNPCYCCDKSAGEHYFSHPLTDDQSPVTGAEWDDLAICLCEKCYNSTLDMTEPEEFIAFSEKKQKTTTT